jgi:hypothetical protein
MENLSRRVRFAPMKGTKKVSGLAAPATAPPSHEQIAALARAIWLDRGSPVGRDLEIWLEAERQLGGVGARMDPGGVDPETAESGRVDRELERIVSPPPPRSPTSL